MARQRLRVGAWALTAMVVAGCSSPSTATDARRRQPAAAVPAVAAEPTSVPTTAGEAVEAPPPLRRPDGTHLSMVEIRDSLIPGAGKGLFARVPIPDDTYIGFYDGRYLTEAEIDELDAFSASYLFLVPDCAEEPSYGGILGDPEHEISKVNFAPSQINGQSTGLQNVEFREHCDEPYERLHAIRDIAAGEELYTDYGDAYEYEFMEFPAVQDHFLRVTGIAPGDTFSFEYSEPADD